MMKKVFIIAAAVLVMVGCQGKKTEQQKPLRCVEVIKPQPISDEVALTYSGKVKENKQVNVAFKTGGAISKVHVRVGDRVRQGQLLAEIDASDYQLGVRNYEAQYNQLKNEVERLKVLREKNSISENDYEKAVTGLQQVEVALQGSRNKVAYTQLYAPASGVILAVNYHAAEMVDAGMAVFSLLEDAGMQVVFDMPVSLYGESKHFEQISCSAAGIPDTLFPMSLAAVTPKADNNQLCRVYLDFRTKPDSRLTPGMNVQVKLSRHEVADSTGHVTVPLRTVCQREAEPFVWVVNPDSTLRKQKVVLDGLDTQGNTRISSGLDGTETLVRAGASTLQDGEKVRILNSGSQTNIGNQL